MNVNSFLKCVREGQSPTKSEEQDFLQAVWLAFSETPANSYLSSLFTQNMVNWVFAQINQDTSCDLLAAVNSAGYQADQRAAKLRAERDEALAEIAKMTRALDSQHEQAEELEQTIQRQKTQIESLYAELTQESRRCFAGTEAMERVMDTATHAWQDDRQIAPEELRGIVNSYEDALANAEAHESD